MTTDTRAVFVISGVLIVAGCLMIQGVYCLKTGLILPFFLRPSPEALRMKLSQRVPHAAIYLVPAVLTFIAIPRMVMRHHVPLARVEEWSEAYKGPLLVVCFLIGSGVWLLLRPSTMVRWVQEAHPEAPPERWVGLGLVIVKMGGTLFLAFAVLILVSVLRQL